MTIPTPEDRNRLRVLFESEPSTTSLVGSFFHTGHERGWQGVIVAEPAPAIYLVETFEWFAGSSTDQHLVTLEEMHLEGWRFYDDGAWMRSSADDVQRRWELETQAADDPTPLEEDTPRAS